MDRRNPGEMNFLQADVSPKTINKEKRCFEVVWSTGSACKRWHPEIGEYLEQLRLDHSSVRLERLLSGAPVLNSHQNSNLSDQIGVVDDAWLADGKAYARLRLSERPDVEAIFNDVSKGIIRNISFGYIVNKREKIDGPGEIPSYMVTDMEPFEISLVTVPADAKAQVRKYETSHVEQGEQSMGAKQSSSEYTKARSFENKEPKNAPPGSKSKNLDPLPTESFNRSKIVLEERQRISSIEDLCRAHDMDRDFTRQLVENGTSESEASRLILDDLVARSQKNKITSEGRGLSIQSGAFDEQQTRRAALKNALVMGFRTDLVPDNEVNENVRSFAKQSITQIMAGELERRGERVSHLNASEIVQRSLHSTSDFPIILGLAGEATIKNSYQRLVEEQTFRPLVRYEVAKDFRPMRKVQLGEIPSFERIPEGAEVTYGTISESADQWAIYKHGKAFAATFEMMVNDQKNLLFTAMTAYAEAAARAESELVWDIFNSNPMVSHLNADLTTTDTSRWFSSQHKNDGTPAPLSHESLEEAEYAMRMQTGMDQRKGHRLGIKPRYLIVPSRLENTARRLIYSQYQATNMADVNLYKNKFDIISETLLNPEGGEKDSYPWYLACDPNILPVVWMAYLHGERSPEVRYYNDFNTLSVHVRASLSFGVSHGDWRGVHRNQGATLAEQREANNFKTPIMS